MKAPSWLLSTGRSINQNSPTILSAAAVGGVIATAYLTAKAASRATDEIRIIEDDKHEIMPNREKIDLTWKYFIPPMITGAATIACIVGAHQIGLRRQAAYLGAYTIADTALREYKQEVLNTLGATKEGHIQDRIAEKEIQNNPPPKDGQIIITGGGDSLCYDRLTGRYFKSDVESIRQVANDVNARIVSDMYASLNEFYELLGLAPADIGDELGFNIENLIELRFSSHLAPDGKPCLAFAFVRPPRPDYGKF